MNEPIHTSLPDDIIERARIQATAKGITLAAHLEACTVRAVLNIDELDRIRAEAWSQRQAS